jgi:hypothetical protein
MGYQKTMPLKVSGRRFALPVLRQHNALFF